MENNEEKMREAAEKFSNLEFEETFAPETEPVEEKQEAEQQKTEKKTVKQEQEPLEVEDNAFEETNHADDDSMYYNNVYDNFRELGLLPDAEELEEGRVLTNEDLVGILEESKKNAAKKMFEEEFLSKFDDDDAREYLNYVINGGSSKDFFKQRMSSPALGIDGDISDERVQDKVIAKYLSEFSGLDDADIAEQIQMYADSGKKEKYARMYLEKIHQYDEAQKETLKREQEIREKQAQEQYQRTVQAFDAEIKATENIFGVKCDDGKRKKIMDMMFKPVRMQDGSTNTEFNIRLFSAMQDPKKAIVLADLLANDFDVSKYSKSIESSITRKIRSGLDSKPKVKKNQTSPFD